MNKQELIEKYKTKGEVCKEFPVVAISDVLKDLRELDEPEQVTIPQFVADFISEQKKLGHTLSYSIDACMSDRVAEWYWGNSELFARAWLDGYTIDEKLYLVKVKGHINENILVYGYGIKKYFFSSNIKGNRRPHHTRKQLEEAGFGEVFNSPLFEVVEVEE